MPIEAHELHLLDDPPEFDPALFGSGTAMEKVRRYERRHRAQGLCVVCPQEAVTELLCERHRQLHAARQARYKARRGHSNGAALSVLPADVDLGRLSARELCAGRDDPEARDVPSVPYESRGVA